MPDQGCSGLRPRPRTARALPEETGGARDGRTQAHDQRPRHQRQPDRIGKSMRCKRDYRVLRVSSGEAALPILNREDIDLILLDVRLPGISGFEVLRIVKENYSLVEVLMISAITEIETAVQAIKAAKRAGFRVTTNTTLFNDAQPERVRAMFDELMVWALMPARAAAPTWLRMSASSGDTSTVAPAPCSRSSLVAMK